MNPIKSNNYKSLAPFKAFLVFFSFFYAIQSGSLFGAVWSGSLGYHNPPNALGGANVMGLWTNFAFEAGVGYFDASFVNTDSTTDKDTAAVQIAGDINGKYIFSGSSWRPYLQVGLGSLVGASVGEKSGASADLGGGFAGLGIFYGLGKGGYGYGSAIFWSEVVTGQLGIGISL